MSEGLGLVGRRPYWLAILMGAAVLAACSSGETSTPGASPSLVASAPASADETESPTASPTEVAALDADHIFGASVDGYAFVELPGSVEREARRQFEATAGLDPEEAELGLRSLTKDGAPNSLVLVVALSPEYAALPGTDRGFVQGMAGSAGTEPEEIELGAATAYVVDNGEQQIVAWQDQNLLVAVFAERRATAIEAAGAIVEATS